MRSVEQDVSRLICRDVMDLALRDVDDALSPFVGDGSVRTLIKRFSRT